VAYERLLRFRRKDGESGPKRVPDTYFQSRKLEAQTLNEELGRFKEDKLRGEFRQIASKNKRLPALRDMGEVTPEEESCLAERHTRLIIASYILDKMEHVFRECKDADSVNLYMHAATSLRRNLLTDDYFSKPLAQIGDDYTAASGFLEALSAKTGIEILEAHDAVEEYAHVVEQRISHRAGIYL